MGKHHAEEMDNPEPFSVAHEEAFALMVNKVVNGLGPLFIGDAWKDVDISQESFLH